MLAEVVIPCSFHLSFPYFGFGGRLRVYGSACRVEGLVRVET